MLDQEVLAALANLPKAADAGLIWQSSNPCGDTGEVALHLRKVIDRGAGQEQSAAVWYSTYRLLMAQDDPDSRR